MRRRRRTGLLALLGLLLGVAPAVAAPLRVALLPLANASDDPAAPALVAPALHRALADRGLVPVPAEEVDSELFRMRIRYTDSLARSQSAALAGAVEADLVAVGRVLSFVTAPVPELGLSLRIIDPASGQIVWAAVHGTRGDRYRRLLGRGELRTMEALLPRALDETLAGLSVQGAGRIGAEPAPAPRRTRLAQDPIDFRDAAELRGVRTVAVLPLLNQSGRRGAEEIVGDVLVARLWGTRRFRLHEPGEMREQLFARRLYPTLVAGPEVLGALHDELGVDAVLGGAILAFHELPPGARAGEPSLEVELRLVSTADGRVLWSSLHSRRGNDAETFYGHGRVLAAPRLAGELIDDLLAELLRPAR